MTGETIIFGTDMDGVLADSQRRIIGAFNVKLDKSVEYADWKTFDFLTLKAAELGNQTPAAAAAWLYGEEVMREAATIPGSVQAIETLNSLGIFPQVITSRPSEQATMTRDWIGANFPSIKSVHIREGEQATMRGDEFKIYMLGLHEINVYVDDDPALLLKVAEAVLAGRLPNLKLIFLADRPWNENAELPNIIRHVGNWRKNDYGWEKVVEIVQEMRFNNR